MKRFQIIIFLLVNYSVAFAFNADNYRATLTVDNCQTIIKKNTQDDTTNYAPEAIHKNDIINAGFELPKSSFKEFILWGKDAEGELKALYRITNPDSLYRTESEFRIIIKNGNFAIQTDPDYIIPNIPYPYHFTVESTNQDKCEWSIGSDSIVSKQDVENESGISQSNFINIMDGVPLNQVPFQFNTDNLSIGLQNRVIVIDCNICPSSPSAYSSIYKKNMKGEIKSVKSLRNKKSVKVYLFNYNPYLYNVSVGNSQIDIKAEKDSFWESFSTPKPKTSSEGEPETIAEESPVDDDKRPSIRKVANIVDQLQSFIIAVKQNKCPNSSLLDKQKIKIKSNLDEANLPSMKDLEKWYQDLPEKQKTSEDIEDAIKKVRLFAQVVAELNTLSYTTSAVSLPIQVKPFDKFQLTVTLSEKETNKKIKAETYEYLITGGVKIDPTFGIVAHGITDEEYALQSITIQDTTFATDEIGRILKTTGKNGSEIDSIQMISPVSKRKIIKDESEEQISIGISTITHFYIRSGFLNFGPVIGLAVDLGEEQRIRYLGGFSIMLNDGRHRISLDAGLAFGKYNALSNTQQVGTLLDGDSNTQPDMKLKSKKSFFLGLSYSVPLSQKNTQDTN